MEPLVSAIIPCYNGARFLADALQSVVTQSYANREVIVVDDGSTDNSEEIVARFPSIRYIRQTNSGVAAARNTGIRNSRGDYIVLLDQDDRLRPNALASNLRCLLDQPACAFAFGDAQSIDAAGAPLPHRSSCPQHGTDHYLSLLRGNYIWTPGVVMYKRSPGDELLFFDPSAEPSDDYELNLRLARQYPACHNNDIVLDYRIHDASTGRRHAMMLRSGITVVRRQRRWARRDRRRRAALTRGLRFVENYYGNLLLTQILTDVRHNRNWRQTSLGLRVLLRYAPLLVLRRAIHRARRVVTAGS